MKYRYTFQVQAPLADIAGFHTVAVSLKAITPPLIPMQLRHAPEQMGDGDETDFTMRMGPLPVCWVVCTEDGSPVGFRARKTRRLLEGAVA